MIVDFQCNDHSRILLSLLSLFFSSPLYISGNRGRFPYNTKPPRTSKGDHALAYFRAPLLGLGILPSSTLPKLFVPEKHAEYISKLMNKHGLIYNNFAIFAPGSSFRGIDRRWPVANYINLANEIAKLHNIPIVLVGTQIDADVCNQISEKSNANIKNLCCDTDILDLLPLAEAARYAVGNDTGTVHISAASGTPTVVLYGSSNSRLARPLGKTVHTIQADMELLEKGINPGKHAIQKIPVSQVIKVLKNY